MTEDKRFIIMDNLPKGTHSSIWDNQKQHNKGIGDELWLGEVVAMLNEGFILAEENRQLKEELNEFKDFVYSDEKILCYSCLNCLSKGIYQIECSEKGKVDVHGSCFAYWKKEVE